MGNTQIINWLYCIIFAFFGVYLFSFFYKRSRDKLNPFGVVCGIWCILGGIANLHLSWMETYWIVDTYIVVTIFPVLVAFCGLVGKNYRTINNKITYIYFSKTYILFTRILFFFVFLCSLIEWKYNGFSVAFNSDMIDAKSSVESIPFIHYGTIYLPYCTINSIFEFIYSRRKNRKTILYLILTFIYPILYCLLAQASRGSLLIVFCAFMYLAFRRYCLPFKLIFFMTIGALIGFVAISQVRIFSDSLVYNVIEGKPLFSSIYGYTMLNFENLNKLIKQGPEWTFVLMTYGGFFQLMGIYDFFNMPEYVITYFFNANTICYDFYADMGLLGVVINTILLFTCIRIWYYKSFKDHRYVLLIATMQKAIWMTFFGNYFTIYRVMLFPFLVTGIVISTMNIKYEGFLKFKRIKDYWKEQI